MMQRIIPLLILFVATAGTVPPDAHAKSNFVTISLPNGFSIAIPRNWAVLSNDEMITLDTTVESKLDLSNLPKMASGLGFVAGYSADTGDRAKVNVRYYPDMKVTQDVVRQANPEDIRQFDNTLKQSIYGAAKIAGATILSWSGTRKQTFGEHIALVTEYRRPPNSGEQGSFNVRLIRILDGSRSVTLTVSYNEVYAVIFKPICDRIISSLKIENSYKESD